MTSGFTVKQLIKMSCARVARVSFLNHEGREPSPEADLKTYERFVQNPVHGSALEPAAHPKPGRHGNFNGWMQWRKYVPNEYAAG